METLPAELADHHVRVLLELLAPGEPGRILKKKGFTPAHVAAWALLVKHDYVDDRHTMSHGSRPGHNSTPPRVVLLPKGHELLDYLRAHVANVNGEPG